MRYRLSSFVRPGGHYHVARVDYAIRGVCELHTHDFAELFFIEDGRGWHHINGRRVALDRGDLVLIRPDDEHGFTTPRGGGFTMVNLAFAAEAVDHLRQRYFDDDPTWPGAGGSELPASWRLDDGTLRRVSDRSLPLSMTGTQRRIDLESFLLDVLAIVTAPGSVAADDPKSPQPQWLRDATAAFAAGDDLAGGPAALAELAGKSTEHVNRTVRRCMGQTATDLVNTIRLDRAAHLLRMTGRPILTVALDAGYDNLGYFYRRFKQRFGVTPRAYRQAAQAVAR